MRIRPVAHAVCEQVIGVALKNKRAAICLTDPSPPVALGLEERAHALDPIQHAKRVIHVHLFHGKDGLSGIKHMRIAFECRRFDLRRN